MKKKNNPVFNINEVLIYVMTKYNKGESFDPGEKPLIADILRCEKVPIDDPGRLRWLYYSFISGFCPECGGSIREKYDPDCQQLLTGCDFCEWAMARGGSF